MLKIGQNWGKIANYLPQCSTKIGTPATSDNQFGFKPLHGTDMCTFLLKEVVCLYNTKNNPVYSVFLDAWKGFDRVNHDMLFCKLWPDPYPCAFYVCFTSGIPTKL